MGTQRLAFAAGKTQKSHSATLDLLPLGSALDWLERLRFEPNSIYTGTQAGLRPRCTSSPLLVHFFRDVATTTSPAEERLLLFQDALELLSEFHKRDAQARRI
jgi:hypothetical protein